MTNEEMQSTMQFILEQQAQFAANMQRLEETDERASKRIDRLERVVGLAIRAGFRERKETREKINALINSQLNLTAAQAHTDERLNALIDVVSDARGNNGSNGGAA
jgi:phage shock protein A